MADIDYGSGMRVDRVPLTIARIEVNEKGVPVRHRYRGEVSMVSHAPAYHLVTHAWEADSPNDIVAWWLQGMPEGGPALLGRTEPEEDEEDERPEAFTPEERLLIRGMLREKQTEISALIMKLDGK